MTSNEIKNAFNAAGIKVRVKALYGSRFRVCTMDGSAHDDRSQTVLAGLGCTTSLGKLGGHINQLHEIFTTAPGVIRYV